MKSTFNEECSSQQNTYLINQCNFERALSMIMLTSNKEQGIGL